MAGYGQGQATVGMAPLVDSRFEGVFLVRRGRESPE